MSHRWSYRLASRSSTLNRRSIKPGTLTRTIVPIGTDLGAAMVNPSTGGRPLEVMPLPFVHKVQQQNAVMITLGIIVFR